MYIEKYLYNNGSYENRGGLTKGGALLRSETRFAIRKSIDHTKAVRESLSTDNRASQEYLTTKRTKGKKGSERCSKKQMATGSLSRQAGSTFRSNP